jgi:hypothetical protein
LEQSDQVRIIQWASSEVPRDGFVVASYLRHPVFRKDTFFKTVNDGAPILGGDGIEAIMPTLTQSQYVEHFQESGYEKELQERPPSLLLLEGNYTAAQIRALNAYLDRHEDQYDGFTIPGTTVLAYKRKAQPDPSGRR